MTNPHPCVVPLRLALAGMIGGMALLSIPLSEAAPVMVGWGAARPSARPSPPLSRLPMRYVLRTRVARLGETARSKMGDRAATKVPASRALPAPSANRFAGELRAAGSPSDFLAALAYVPPPAPPAFRVPVMPAATPSRIAFPMIPSIERIFCQAVMAGPPPAARKASNGRLAAASPPQIEDSCSTEIASIQGTRSAFNVAGPSATVITLEPGQSRVLEFSGIERVVIGDPAVADVVPVSTTDIVLSAKSKTRGETTLFVWDKRGRRTFRVIVEPVAPDLAGVADQLRAALDDPEIQVRVLGETLFLEGDVDNAARAQRAELMAKALTPNVQNLIQVQGPPPPAPILPSEQAARLLNDALAKSGVQARALDENKVIVEGSVPTADADRVRRIIESMKGTMTVVDALETIAPEQEQVQIRARVVDINRSRLKNLGLNWGSISSRREGENIEYTFVEQPVLFAVIDDELTNVLPFGSQLNAAIQENAARILSEPNILVLEGAQGNILIGGEFPIPVVQNQAGGLGAITVQFKEFGIRLQVQPIRIENGEIILRVAPEVSLLDFANAITVSGITLPALRTRREETTIRIRDGQMLAIGGLIANDYSKSVRRVPFLSKIPILGELFKSKSWNRNESELVILIAPHIVPPGAAAPTTPLGQQGGEIEIKPPKVPPDIWPGYKTPPGKEQDQAAPEREKK